MTRDTKTKRRALGQTEEDNNISKRANIAAEESMPLEEPTASPQLSEEPTDPTDVTSLKELKEMLIDIQISISNILLDNRKTRNRTTWPNLQQLFASKNQKSLDSKPH